MKLSAISTNMVTFWKTKAKSSIMMICTHQKQERKSETLLEKRSGLTVITAKDLPLQNLRIMHERKDTIAQPSATLKTVKKTGNHMSIIHGRGALVAMKLTVSGLLRTKSECLILKLEDMQEKKEQKARIPLKNGKNLKKYTVMYVLTVKRVSRSLKTISCLYQKVAQTTLRTFSHYAEIAIARSGLSFNIYENPELINNIEKGK